jgi:hypothetical protein
MTSSPPPATPERELPVRGRLSHHVDIVWGAPSDEMLEAEARGEIILVEDIYQRRTPVAEAEHHGAGA